MSSKRTERGAGPDQSSGSLIVDFPPTRLIPPDSGAKTQKGRPEGRPQASTMRTAYCEFVVVVLVVVVVAAAGAIVLSVVAGAIVLSVVVVVGVVVVSVVVVFSVVLVAAGLPQAATERAATAAVATRSLRRVLEVISLGPLRRLSAGTQFRAPFAEVAHLGAD